MICDIILGSQSWQKGELRIKAGMERVDNENETEKLILQVKSLLHLLHQIAWRRRGSISKSNRGAKVKNVKIPSIWHL